MDNEISTSENDLVDKIQDSENEFEAFEEQLERIEI